MLGLQAHGRADLLPQTRIRHPKPRPLCEPELDNDDPLCYHEIGVNQSMLGRYK
jgi:hypothetical protein